MKHPINQKTRRTKYLLTANDTEQPSTPQ